MPASRLRPQPDWRQRVHRGRSPPRNQSSSTKLEQRRPGLPARLRSFLPGLADLDVTPKFRKSLVLRWHPSPDVTGSAGYIDTSGKLWAGDAWNAANRLGIPDAGERYLQSIAEVIGGSVRRYEKSPPTVIGPDGKGV